jgi:hypothetical protein
MALFDGGEVTLAEARLLRDLYPRQYPVRAKSKADKGKADVFLAQEVALDRILAEEHGGSARLLVHME